MTKKAMTAYQYEALKAACVHPRGRVGDIPYRSRDAMDDAWLAFTVEDDWSGDVITDDGRAAVAEYERQCTEKGKKLPLVTVEVFLRLDVEEWGRFAVAAEREGVDVYEKLAQLASEYAAEVGRPKGSTEEREQAREG